MNILFTGKKGIGKSTALKRLLVRRNYEVPIFGVIASEILKDGERCGFKAEAVNSYGNRVRTFAHTEMFLDSPDIVANKYHVDRSAIDDFIIPEIEAGCNEKNGLLVIDEIGRMQHCSKKFLAVIRKALNGPANVLATIVYNEKWANEFKNRPDVIVVKVIPENREQLPELLAQVIAGLDKYGQLPNFRKKVVDDMVVRYIKHGQLIQIQKLFAKAIPRSLEFSRIKLVHCGYDGVYHFVIEGTNQEHCLVVTRKFTSDEIYLTTDCDCDLFNGVGQYVGQAGECSHHQLYRLWKG